VEKSGANDDFFEATLQAFFQNEENPSKKKASESDGGAPPKF